LTRKRGKMRVGRVKMRIKTGKIEGKESKKSENERKIVRMGY
jgi:hypothetical protein